MNLADIERAFRERTGLDPGALGSSAFVRAVQWRMDQKGILATDEYSSLLTSDPAEPEALATEVVVPETWFFRGGRALFDLLAQILASRAATRDSLTPVRALSFPCSTGEEPYSLVIALREAGLPPDRCQVDAVDLSARHLALAARGRFSSSSFRESVEDIRAVWGQPDGETWEIDPEIREAVRFRRGNIADPAFLRQEPPYDLILCRNLFIYLTPEARRHAMVVLDRLLAPDGWLCLSAAEADRTPRNRFVQEGPIEFGLYHRVNRESSVTPTQTISRPTPATYTRRPKVATPEVPSSPTPRRESAPKPTPAHADDKLSVTRSTTLQAVRLLADAGQISEAQSECDRFLIANPDSADAHALLGIILLATSNQFAAADAFRKALYLNPHHAEALAHMIVISDARGDGTYAIALRKRLARTQSGGSK